MESTTTQAPAPTSQTTSTSSTPASGGSSSSSSSAVQRKAALRGQDMAAQEALLSPSAAPVQLRGDGGEDPSAVHAAAESGVKGGGGPLPYLDRIQASFGAHDVGHVSAHQGSEAKAAGQAMGASAYASGSDVAFAETPDLHTAAHEAAHIVQQEQGVSLSGGVGQAGDSYEQHADQVADAVVAGKSAEGLLGGAGGGGGEVQQKSIQRKAVQRAVGDPAPRTTTPPPTDPSATTPPAAPAPLTRDTAKTAVDGKTGPGFGDISQPYATTLVGKTQAEFDADHADPAVVKNKVIKGYLTSGGAPRALTQTVGNPDPIAIQKFADVDNEAHLVNPGLKDTFYLNLVTEMSKATYVDRTRTFPAMQAAAPPATFAAKGTPIPADRISPFSARNHSVDRMYSINTVKPDIDAAIAQPLIDANARPATIAAAQADEGKRKKAYRHLLATGRDPLTTINRANPISQYPTWYAPGSITPDTSAPPNAEFAKMMTLGALQPEWYPNGTVILNITRTTAAASRTCLKPTAFDGMMSALWCARNIGENDYGVTGGGLGEFLEAAVSFNEVSSATAIIPTDDFLADMQRVASQVRNELGSASTPTEEMVRGNGGNTSIANTSPGVSGMYGGIVDRSTREQNTPQAAQPVAPGAARPTSAATAGAPAAAPGGAYDTTSGPRAP